MSEAGFSGTQAAKIVGITYRQLDYWARTDLIRPSLTDAAGSGSRRRYCYRDLLELRVIKSLLDAGIKLESVRNAFEYLREHVDTDIASAHLVISGSDVDPVRRRRADRRDAPRRSGRAQRASQSAASKTDLDSTIVKLDDGSIAASARRADVMSELRASARSTRCTARSAPRWCRSAAGTCRCSTRRHDRRAPRVPQRCRRVRRVAPRHGARRGRRRRRAAAVALTNDLDKIAPGRAQYTHLLDEVDALGARRHHRVVGRRRGASTSCRTPRNTDRVRAAIGGRRDRRTTVPCSPCRARGAGARLATVIPEAAAVGRFQVARLDWDGTAASSPAPATPARTASRSPCPPTLPPPICGRRSPAPASRPPASAPATRCGSRPALPLHGHELGPGITPLQAGLGWVVAWSKAEFRGREPLARRAGVGRPARAHGHRHRRPAAAARRLRGVRRRSTRSASSPAATSHPCSGTASPWPSCHRPPQSAPKSSSTSAAPASRPSRADPLHPQALASLWAPIRAPVAQIATHSRE